LITFFATPISTVLFPAFSKLNPQKETDTLRNVFQFSVKYAALLVVPAAAALIALSQPAISTLFGEKYTYAPLYLALIAISYLYTAFGNLSLGNLINGQGKTRFTLKLTLITSAIGLPLSLLLIPKFGIVGLITTTLTAGIPSLIIGLWWIRKHFTVTIDWTSSAKILITSTLAALIAHTIISQLTLPNWAKLIIGATAFLATYATTTPLIGAINKTDIQNLREMLNELGPISHLSKLPLDIIEKLARAT
ncbi:polysaccharide biosynthesis C-terminal domain-containing protein, partial [Candidatus Bathyarchaeota archaeon]|nr:polysaccharide biosynthesis C-terminal domain-containing protein [Candidatus Bathyarchaeota archaeon]